MHCDISPALIYVLFVLHAECVFRHTESLDHCLYTSFCTFPFLINVNHCLLDTEKNLEGISELWVGWLQGRGCSGAVLSEGDFESLLWRDN